MGFQYGNGSVELTDLFDCARGVLEYAIDDIESSLVLIHFLGNREVTE